MVIRSLSNEYSALCDKAIKSFKHHCDTIECHVVLIKELSIEKMQIVLIAAFIEQL